MAELSIRMCGMNQKAYNDKLSAQAEKRRIRVRALRAEGKTWAEIGARLKISRQRAYQLGSK